MLSQHTTLSFLCKIDATARVKFLSKAGAKETRNHIEFIACGVLFDKKKLPRARHIKSVSRLARRWRIRSTPNLPSLIPEPLINR